MNKVKIKVCDKTFVLSTDRETEYMLGLADKIEKKINEITSTFKGLDKTSAALLVAIEMAEENDSNNDVITGLRGKISEYLGLAGRAHDERDSLKEENQKLKEEIKTLKAKIKDEKQSNEQQKTEEDNIDQVIMENLPEKKVKEEETKQHKGKSR